MLQKRNADFAEEVWRASARLDSMSPPRIGDDIINRLFPRTVNAAEDEGAGTMLRKGVIAAVKTVLGGIGDDAGQGDLANIDPTFAPQVHALKRPSYHVEARGELVPIAELIRTPELLDDARKFMRRKSIETAEEADRLDQLYDAVIAKRDAPGLGL